MISVISKKIIVSESKYSAFFRIFSALSLFHLDEEDLVVRYYINKSKAPNVETFPDQNWC